MPHDFEITIFHNPACGSSRSALAEIKARGHAPKVVEYLKVGWTRVQLEELLSQLGATPRELLREKEAVAGELGLSDAAVGDERILEAMVAHPILVNRPIVVTPSGARLCRPPERVRDLLDPHPSA